ncbi:hypothetical protein NPJ88_020210, partial [Halomonas elongata]|uniref:hypothetical protein n=1 Tax=Halomonas elongata TaxID=2746 RepID=UPI00255AC5A9
MRHFLLPLLLGIVLAGCQALPPSGGTQRDDSVDITDISDKPDRDIGRVARQVDFPEDEYAALEKTGNAALSGRLTLDTASGTVIGAGQTVSVAPVTTYSAEAAEQALAGRAVERADPR